MKSLYLLLAVLMMEACGAQELASPAQMAESDQALLQYQSPRVDGSLPNGSCGDARGEFLLTNFQYQGGARPGPTLVTASTVLKWQGKIIGKSTFREGGAEKGDNRRWMGQVKFLGTAQVLASTGNPTFGTSTYGQQVELTLDSTKVPFQFFVICETTWALGLP